MARTLRANSSRAAAAAAVLLPVAGCATFLPLGAPRAAPALVAFTQTIPGTTATLEMVPVPQGQSDRERVGPFWVASREVTWDLYDVFVYRLDEPARAPGGADALARPSKPYISMDRGFGHVGYPALSMSARGAEAFCAWLSDRTGRRYRLPTERQWRVLCRLSGIAPARLDAHAWHRGNAQGTTHPVGKKAPDALGLHDLFGNASEWCRGDDGEPVTMGGCFRDPIERLGCGARVEPTPEWNASDPQLPKSVWWLADAGFVGCRVVCLPQETHEGEDDHDQP